MRVFIVGAAGYIGSHVAAGLAKRGHEVHALAHTEPHYLHFKELGYTPVFGNMLHDEGWRAEAEQAEALINTSFLRLGLRHGALRHERAVQAEESVTLSLVAAAFEGGRCRVLIDTSGLSALGDHGDYIVDEDTPPAASEMGRMHLAGEALVREAAASGLNAVTLRLGMVYGPDGPFAEHFLAGGQRGHLSIIGEGQNYVSPVHIDDVVEAYALAVERPAPAGVLHVCDDEPISMHTFAKRTLACFGGGLVHEVPTTAVSLFAGPPIAEMSVGSARSHNHHLRATLGWSPRYADSTEGLKAAVREWIKTHNP